MRAGLHAMRQAGIHGDSRPGGGAYSICLSEGYEDNRDDGDRMYVHSPLCGNTRSHFYLQPLRRLRYALCND